VRRRALAVAARAVEQRLNADHTDHTGAQLPCPGCGAPARYAGRREKRVTSVLGELRVARAYYHCEACAAGFCPRDAALGVQGAALSPGVTRMVGQVGAMVSFAEGHDLLRALAGVEVATKHVERAAEALGREIARDERRVVAPPPPDEPVAPTLYLGLDGTGVPMRPSEIEGRPGKQPDGAAKTREVKLCTVWSAEGRDAEGTPVRDAGSVTYSAAIESAASKDIDATPSAFAARVEREATRRGFDQAPRRAVLGDGAPWIWNLATEHFPGAVQIVDRFHAKQHLSDAGKAVYGAPSARARLGARASRRVGRWRPRRGAGGAAGPRGDPRRRAQVPRLRRAEPRAHALPRVPGGGAVYLDWRGRGWLQGGHRDTLQAGRHALDGRRCRRHHRAAVLHAERALRGLLGAAIRRQSGGRMTLSHNPDVRPAAPRR